MSKVAIVLSHKLPKLEIGQLNSKRHINPDQNLQCKSKVKKERVQERGCVCVCERERERERD